MKIPSRPKQELPILSPDDLDGAVGGFVFVPALYMGATALMGSGVAMTALMNPATATRWGTSALETAHSVYNYVSQADWQGMSAVLRGEPLRSDAPAAPTPWDGQFRTMDQINQMLPGATPAPATTGQPYDEFKGVDQAVQDQAAQNAWGPSPAVQDPEHALSSLPAPEYPTQAPTIDTTGASPNYSDEQLAANRADLGGYQDTASPEASSMGSDME